MKADTKTRGDRVALTTECRPVKDAATAEFTLNDVPDSVVAYLAYLGDLAAGDPDTSPQGRDVRTGL